jgi:hypothetical protein
MRVRKRRRFDRKTKRPVQKDGPEIADGWLVSPSRATESPVRQDMEMVRMVGCGTSHALM